MAVINGTNSDDYLQGFLGNDNLYGYSGNDNLEGGPGIDSLFGGEGNDSLFGDGGDDYLYGESGNDILYGESGDDYLDGGSNNYIFSNAPPDLDTANFGFTLLSEVTEVRHLKAGGAIIISPDGTDTLVNIERLEFYDATITAPRNLFSYGDVIRTWIESRPLPTFSGATTAVTFYTGPVAWLAFENLGTSANNAITGSNGNDFINVFAGDDAVNGGLGDDVLDGGIGSNFLTGGGDDDTFYLDGRGGTATWSTITDFAPGVGLAGDEVNIWGWNAGTSKLLLTQANGGATGYTGATFHYDLNNDNTIDTSITFTGLSLAQVPTSQALNVAGNGYLLIG